MASVRRRKKQKSCSSLRRKARRIKNRRKRKAALRRLPARCRRPVAATPPRQPAPPPATVIPPGTQPTVPEVPSPPGEPTASAPDPPAEPPAETPPPPPAPEEEPPATDNPPLTTYSGQFGLRQAERLLWRAGFGPRPGITATLLEKGFDGAVEWLTRPEGEAALSGPEPVIDGEPLDPYGVWGHDQMWWFDRMVRSSQPLVERMCLIWHDWFATSRLGVGSAKLMLDQNDLFRRRGLGNFQTLLRDVTVDPAMLIWLSGLENRKGAINENYGRELMELFTLGADRGAYTERDVRELARALSGWKADWDPDLGPVNFRFAPHRWDEGNKTVFGKRGAFGWEDAVQLVVEHPLHPSFFVTKLWSYFIPTPPSEAQVEALSKIYTESGLEIRPVLEAILRTPELYGSARMVKPPVVFAAGALRALRQGIYTDRWPWTLGIAGQQLFHPPDVSGWDDSRWLDTNTMAGRWMIVNDALYARTIEPSADYPPETAAQALAAARELWRDPELTDETVTGLSKWAAAAVPTTADGWQRAARGNALKMLVGMCPDHHTS
jgi:hypothetical protein